MKIEMPGVGRPFLGPAKRYIRLKVTHSYISYISWVWIRALGFLLPCLKTVRYSDMAPFRFNYGWQVPSFITLTNLPLTCFNKKRIRYSRVNCIKEWLNYIHWGYFVGEKYIRRQTLILIKGIVTSS